MNRVQYGKFQEMVQLDQVTYDQACALTTAFIEETRGSVLNAADKQRDPKEYDTWIHQTFTWAATHAQNQNAMDKLKGMAAALKLANVDSTATEDTIQIDDLRKLIDQLSKGLISLPQKQAELSSAKPLPPVAPKPAKPQDISRTASVRGSVHLRFPMDTSGASSSYQKVNPLEELAKLNVTAGVKEKAKTLDVFFKQKLDGAIKENLERSLGPYKKLLQERLAPFSNVRGGYDENKASFVGTLQKSHEDVLESVEEEMKKTLKPEGELTETIIAQFNEDGILIPLMKEDIQELLKSRKWEIDKIVVALYVYSMRCMFLRLMASVYNDVSEQMSKPRGISDWLAIQIVTERSKQIKECYNLLIDGPEKVLAYDRTALLIAQIPTLTKPFQNVNKLDAMQTFAFMRYCSEIAKKRNISMGPFDEDLKKAFNFEEPEDKWTSLTKACLTDTTGPWHRFYEILFYFGVLSRHGGGAAIEGKVMSSDLVNALKS